MGVQGLWVLLEPVGRRVNIEALTNKRLAIDASIWLHQFLKAMRDEKGEVLKNAHLLGFFRRICRLLFHRVRPVFVFDGATPALKRRTTIARRRQREQQAGNLRKTAEKLLLAQLKRHALTTLSEAPSDRQLQQHLKLHPEAVEAAVQRLAHEGDSLREQAQPQLQLPSTAGDELLAAQLTAERHEDSENEQASAQQNGPSASAPASSSKQSPFKAASQQATAPAAAGSGAAAAGSRGAAAGGGSGEAADDEEWEPGGEGAESADESSSDDDADGALAMIPEGADTLDPAVLSTLPPSLQLELMAKLREQKTYRNREEFATRSGNPLGFSSFQMQQYLATSAVRRQMDRVKDSMNAAAMAGAGGAQAHRIAAQADREYILTHDGDAEADAGEQDCKGSQGLKADSGSIEMSLQLPAGASVEELFRRGSSQQLLKQESGGGSDGEDWEDVEEPPGTGQGSGGKQFPVPQNWRERKAQRQRFWSMSHGFQFGRKLADWGKGDGETAGDEGADGDGDGEHLGDYEEDQELQEAIRRSLRTGAAGTQVKVEDGDSDIEWMSDDEPQLMHKTDSAPTPLSPSKRGVQLPPAPRQLPQAAAAKPPLPSPGKQLPKAASVPISSHQKTHSMPVLPSIPEQQLDPEPEPDHKQQFPPVSDVHTSAAAGDHEADQKLPAGVSAGKHESAAMYQPQDEPAIKQSSSMSLDETAAVQVQSAAAADESAAVRDESAAAQGEPAPAYESAAVRDESATGPAPSVSQLRDVSAAAHESSGRHQADSTAGQQHQHRKGRRLILSSDDEDDAQLDADEAAWAAAQEAAAAAAQADDDDNEAAMILQGAREQPSSGRAQQLIADRQEAGWKPEQHRDAAIEREHEANRDMQLVPQPEGYVQQRAPADRQPEAASQLRPAASPQAPQPGPSSSMDIEAELESLEKQTKALQAQHRKQAGGVDTPTGEMFGECQELLQMFGLPYIIAPMEAEAQCAWLNGAGLVDGVVTDDNDVFLFGARHVYRHIFEDKKYVEEYRTEDLESELGIDREAMIRMALLLGSDYTEGAPGIGIVNALEIVRAFPTDESLKGFREWVDAPDAEALAAAQGKQAEIDEGEPEEERDFKRKHRGARRAWQLPDGFPNHVVIDAYTQPRVDSNKEKFTYARPDLQLLRGFCRDKFGWAPDKVDQLLLPVLKAYEERQSQLTMDAFLSFSQRFAKVKSTRLQKALATGGPKRARNLEALSMASPEKPKKPKQPSRKRQKKAGEAAVEAGAEAAEGQETGVGNGSQEEQLLQGTGVFSLDGAEADEQLPKELGAAAEAEAASGSRPKRKRKAAVPGGSKRGKGTSRGRGSGRGRGRRKAAEPAAKPEASSSSSSSDNAAPDAAAVRGQPMATRAVKKPGGYAEQLSEGSEGEDPDSDDFEDV